LSDSALPPPPSGPTITRLSNLTHTDPGVPLDEHTVVDFDHPNAPGFDFTGGFVRPGSAGLWPGVSAPPPGDLTNYETTSSGQTGTFTSPYLLKNFSFYLGSPDSFNSVELIGPGYDWLLKGDAIWGGTPPGNGDQGLGLRIRYDFGANRVNKILFSSSGNSFEFDTLAAGGVPEPATWGLMIAGFGAMGAMLRRRRAVASVA
ncbi:MAG TPA: PEPxxWA-CTERM sorting domain-containing protein, partial [Phenylobacterium sp.]